MAIKLNLKNLGFGALLERIEAMPDFPDRPNGVPTSRTNLELMAANQNELIQRVAALEARPAAPFPLRAGS